MWVKPTNCIKCTVALTEENVSLYRDMCKSCFKDMCTGCYYNQGGCRCEDLMAAGCIPTYKTYQRPVIEELEGADISLVYLNHNLPHCKIHGDMNQVSKDGIWRCISTGGDCRAGCIIKEK